MPVDLPGALYFAGHSPQWHGGVAFYDHDAEGGPTAARAYLITAHQFADIAAQEMYRVPQEGDPLAEVVIGGIDGGRHHVGPGSLRDARRGGSARGRRRCCCSPPRTGVDHVEHTQPSPAYLAMLADGLRESRQWRDEEVEAYFERVVPQGRRDPA